IGHLGEMTAQFIQGERRCGYSMRLVSAAFRHDLRLSHHRLRAVGDRVDLLVFLLPAAPFLESRINAAQHGFERDARTLPAFDQRPIERREQKQPGSASLLEALLYFRVVVEVVERLLAAGCAWIRSHISLNPSRVRSGSQRRKNREPFTIKSDWPPVATVCVC